MSGYYSALLDRHGATPTGVDWNSQESQRLRFVELLKVVDWSGEPSLIDYGCGYGALAQQLLAEGRAFTYTGFDLAESMVDAARALIDEPCCRFTTDPGELAPADYTLASGIFNVKLDVGDTAWERYVEGLLEAIASLSRRGFAFNMLTRHADPPLMRDDLYYGDPARYFRLCAERYSRSVALLHDYQLYEFTILVRLGNTPKPLVAQLA